MTDKEALKLALDALNKLTDVFLDTEGSYGNYETNAIDQGYEAIAALKEQLAQPEQEPVVGTKTWFEDGKVITQYLHPSDIYIDPPQRTEQEPDDIASIIACRDMLDAQPVPPKENT
jgi:hypothetical protein